MAYPTVNYIGNKEKIANWISSLIPSDANSFLDVFAGGCSVAYKAKEMGLQVFTNDILKINCQIAEAIIENQNDTLSEEDVNIIFSGVPYEGFMTINYADKFYYREECMELDLYRSNIDKLSTKYKRALALILMRRAMIRKMPYSRFTIQWEKVKQLRDEEFSYQHYKRRRHYHNQSFKFHFLDNLKEYNGAVFNNHQNNVTYNLDVYEAIKQIRADVIYLDPPYAGTMNDYFGFYGLLDSYIEGRIVEPFKNNFIDKKSITAQFEKLIQNLGNYKYWMLSYNSRSFPSKEILLELFSKYSGDVKLYEMPYAYRVTGKEKKQKDIEYLFIAKNSTYEKQS